MNIGEKLPDLAYKATSGQEGQFADLHGRWLIFYFYPRDATPGCTTEGQDFRDNYAQFSALNASIFGISRDTLKAHERFKAAQEFPFELISDPEEEICQAFDVMRTKSMYGKTVRGIERATYIFDPKGILQHEWRKVSVPGHVTAVLEELKKLQQQS